MSEMKLPKKNYAFIDGSFNPETKVYGCGGFLIDQHGRKHIIMKNGDNPRKAKMRNVAGELLGAQTALRLAKDLGMTTLKIFYDYEGVEHWVTGVWKTKKKETIQYKTIMTSLMKGIKVTFEHVRGHAGILENEEADRLAKEAVGLKKKEGRKLVRYLDEED